MSTKAGQGFQLTREYVRTHPSFYQLASRLGVLTFARPLPFDLDPVDFSIYTVQ